MGTQTTAASTDVPADLIGDIATDAYIYAYPLDSHGTDAPGLHQCRRHSTVRQGTDEPVCAYSGIS